MKIEITPKYPELKRERDWNWETACVICRREDKPLYYAYNWDTGRMAGLCTECESVERKRRGREKWAFTVRNGPPRKWEW